MRRILLLPLLAAPLLAGCAANRSYRAAEELQPVNPHAALEYIALALRDDPNDEKTRDLLKSVIQAIVVRHETAMETMIRAGAYEEALAECDRVIVSAALVRSLPGGPYNLYYRENQRSELTGPAAGQAYAAAVRSEEAGDFRSAVDAYDRALGLVDNYRDARTRREALIDRVTTRLYIPPVAPDRDPAAARILGPGVAAAAAAARPRFLKLAGSPEDAGAVCRIAVESSTFNDSGWQSERDSRKVEQTVYDKKGEAIGKTERMAYWTVFRRRTSYRLAAGFTVEAADPGGPSPSGRADAEETSEVEYATWHGEREGVPAEVLNLTSSPTDPKNRETLTAECASRVAADLGHRLFLAYK